MLQRQEKAEVRETQEQAEVRDTGQAEGRETQEQAEVRDIEQAEVRETGTGRAEENRGRQRSNAKALTESKDT
jgi:hypothetical protein